MKNQSSATFVHQITHDFIDNTLYCMCCGLFIENNSDELEQFYSAFKSSSCLSPFARAKYRNRRRFLISSELKPLER